MWTQVCHPNFVKVVEWKFFLKVQQAQYFIKAREKTWLIGLKQNIQFAILTSLWTHQIVQVKKSQPISIFEGVISKEHAFIRNISDEHEFKQLSKIKTLEKYQETCWLFLQIVLLLNTRYSSKSDVEDVSDNCTANFVRENNFESFEKLFFKVDNIKIKNIGRQKSEKCTFTSWQLLPTLASWNFQITNTK